MAQVINTNIASLNAQRNLSTSQGQLQTSLERLSTGLRINSAKDDAAGLAIAERFTSQIRGLDQATRNANDGISFAQTAEGALGEVGNALQRIRELAVQSANDTNSSSDRQALNNEVQELISEVNRISNSTQFNGQNILDGTLSNLVFQVGANQGQTIEVDGVDARGSQLGAEAYEGDTFERSNISALVSSNDLEINGEAVDLTGATDVSDVVSAINAIAADSNVTANRASSTDAELAYVSDGTNNRSIAINGVQIDIASGTRAADAAALIDDVSGQTGVTATESGTNITLTSSDGASIELDEDSTNAVFNTTAPAGGVASPGAGNSETYDPGIELFTDVDDTISITAGTASEVRGIGLETGSLTPTKDIVNDVSVVTRSDASDALRTMDLALEQVNGLRAELGAVQTRFESTIANLSTSSENLSAARSRIQDADFAAETANLTKAQILQQAGTSVLAQANQIPQNVLSLLQ